MKFNRYIVSVIVVVVIIFILGYCFSIYLQTPYEYLCKNQSGLSSSVSATEFLTEEKYEDKYILFYINKNGNVACAILKRKLLSYEVLHFSAELSRGGTDYIFSSWYYGQNYEWIDWEIIRGDEVTSVLADGIEMNETDKNGYGFRIFWLAGSGYLNGVPEHTYTLQ